MKTYLTLAIILFSLVNCQRKEINPPDNNNDKNQIVIGQIDSVYSDILNESRKIWVHIPQSAENNIFTKNKYPVLYLLDGPFHFYSVVGMVQQLSANNVIPEMIVIAIPNTDRSLDLTPTHVDIDFFTGDSIQYSSGGGDKFLDFIENELIPYVDKTYPAAPYKTFVGHSFGGLSVINALTSRPHLFKNYIAIDPSLWWDDQAFLNTADSILSVDQFKERALFVGVANTMEKGMKIDAVQNDTTRSTAHIRSILQFVNSTESKKENGLQFGWKYYNNDDHGSVPLITEYDALRLLFQWYTFDEINEFYDPNSNTTTDELIELVSSHYKTISDNFGYEVLPPEQLINNFGYALMNNEMFDKASAIFDLNIQNYPESTNVYDSRGDCYLAQQDSIKALELFIKALEVGSNDFSQEKIDMLNQNLKK